MNEKTAQVLINLFTQVYSPYSIKDYKPPKREYDDIPFSKDRPQDRTMIFTIDQKRDEDPGIGAVLAGKEILLNLNNWLKNDTGGVHAETLLAIIGSLAGRECVNGLIDAADQIVEKVNTVADAIGKMQNPSMSKPEVTNNNSITREQVLDIIGLIKVETITKEAYYIGDRIGNTFLQFYCNASKKNANIAINDLLNLAKKNAGNFGSEYWKTPFDDYVKVSPLELADKFENKFNFTFNVYCRFPYERVIAYGLAAQKAIESLNELFTDERALQILAEYGWRTSHYANKHFT